MIMEQDLKRIKCERIHAFAQVHGTDWSREFVLGSNKKGWFYATSKSGVILNEGEEGFYCTYISTEKALEWIKEMKKGTFPLSLYCFGAEAVYA